MPSQILAEDPDLLSTLQAVIEWHDDEAEKAAKRRR